VNDIETQDLLLMDKGELISKIKQLESDCEDYEVVANCDYFEEYIFIAFGIICAFIIYLLIYSWVG